jgi:hypothetical protein
LLLLVNSEGRQYLELGRGGRAPAIGHAGNVQLGRDRRGGHASAGPTWCSTWPPRRSLCI